MAMWFFSPRVLLAIVALVAAFTSQAATLPAAPQIFDVTYSRPSGNTITVNAGGNLQSAIDSAQLGDTIVLQAGATFNGSFTLPNKSGSGWIYIQSSAYSSLPAPGSRVSPSHASSMAKITVNASGSTSIRTAPGAHHYRFVGIEFAPVAGNFVYNLISIGNGETSVSSMPNNIVFDRCFIHGDPLVGGRRGVAMDGTYVAVIDSHVSDFKEAGADTQALWAHNTPGPLKIVNNYLEAAGENVMFGGAEPRIQDVLPSDIEIRRNHFFKPLTWRAGPWSVKNLLEFKNARRVLVDGNRFENNWAASQVGFSLLLTPRNETGGAPWSAVQDIAITNNVFFNLGQGINISGSDNNYPSQRTARVLIRNNLISVSNLGDSGGRLIQITRGPVDVTVQHNTGFSTSAYVFAENTPGADQFVFQDNLVMLGNYGFTGTGSGDGLSTLNTHFEHWTYSKNAVIGGSASSFGGTAASNFFPSSLAAVQFVNYAGGDYRLAAGSPYRNAASDGKDVGADMDAIAAAAAAGALLPTKVPMAPGAVTVQ
jgi:hypothetical protein